MEGEAGCCFDFHCSEQYNRYLVQICITYTFPIFMHACIFSPFSIKNLVFFLSIFMKTPYYSNLLIM